MPVHGIHHVTAIAGDPQENLDFYVGLLGMRLVKRSVNQDVPGTYHLFYADAVGSPGTDLTFFPWPDMPPARYGTGHVVEVSLAIPSGSLAYWLERFEREHVQFGDKETRFGETTLPFSDPHGLPLSLVESDDRRMFVPWEGSTVPAEYQIRGMHAVRLLESEIERTEVLLTEIMGFEEIREDAGWRRYGTEGGGSGQLVEIRAAPEEHRGAWGTGGVHHVAWRVHDDDEELKMRKIIEQVGLGPSPPIDRFWFKSVYFREPGGVLFELATDGPGFGRDESMENLGERLILPPWLEGQRNQIEAGLPPLQMPSITGY